MRRTLKPFFLLVFFSLSLLSLPEKVTGGLRSLTASAVAPFWKGVERKKGRGALLQEERLQVENQRLKAEMETLKEWIVSEGRREEELSRLLWLKGQEKEEEGEREFYKRRIKEIEKLIDLQMQALPARVIYRDPLSWSSSLWLDVGKKTNERLGKEIVAKESPVVMGSSLVGVVEQVEREKCRVRLITDSGLVPSVRAVRGEETSRLLTEQLKGLRLTLKLEEELKGSSEEKRELLERIERVLLTKGEEKRSAYLAKGELFGSSAPLWRSRGNLLQGVGFNYDFGDEEGPARHLRNGQALDGSAEKTPLLQVGDLLVTTGFDGIFPPGLHVARVVEIGRLREGASSYELRAKPTAGSLDYLETLFVLPPFQRASSAQE
ncbi:MAG: hypothetical protein A2Y28_05100 [Chlamydiae bacterium GWC2_50_10]|nr:MAG: hypothetical protein A2Z85_02275 [Chlamydiae bacterium GWA2_50_15]OGN54336.1 MAG: hypothetical protein A2Y28_05100 [Chlamydiae bacterium GWC2_50_10]OGN59005.1 MAG: hypothetical protein A3D18_02375 [Chlamydiae bacterium RIFCSPHIGHO2_02_FULL_49_29]OGN71681.1 MAG: hypothetical protein A3I15_02330 [Chlamydiae bacterium RIFCSPLOWO2_02_FULL_49_12]OGN75241.1 MAG: hypothetical protein A3G30_05405 [Chlamydiae bacterium RIFCSPLOWO2_12_FULL_49_12]HAZ15509.1 rod shape-determining protein MreC [Par